MKILRLSLTNFRGFSRLDTEIPEGMLILAGDNAQGKTSLLEAIFYFATFTSHHVQNDRQMINFLALKEPLAVARLVAEFSSHSAHHKMEIRLIVENTAAASGRLKKEILVDGVRKTVSQALGLFNAVIFLPQMTTIIEDSPDERRRYVNLAISQVNPHYARALSQYAKALERRNALLKDISERGGDLSQLDYWDELLVSSGSEIIALRMSAIHELEQFANDIYLHISGGKETVRFQYLPAYNPARTSSKQQQLPLNTEVDLRAYSVGDIKKGFLIQLVENRKEEILRGVTTIGPHRDEIRFIGNGIDLGDFGSRGQIRSLLMALKLAEVSWMKEKTGEVPVLLLDETMAELDTHRRADLLSYLRKQDQSILTTTDLSMFPKGFAEQALVWKVKLGMLEKDPKAG